jgi:hypothetical protein
MELKVGMKFEAFYPYGNNTTMILEIKDLDPATNTVKVQEMFEYFGNKQVGAFYSVHRDNFLQNLKSYNFQILNDNGITSLNGCQHDRKTYTGLFEVFDYCAKCNEKL